MDVGVAVEVGLGLCWGVEVGVLEKVTVGVGVKVGFGLLVTEGVAVSDGVIDGVIDTEGVGHIKFIPEIAGLMQATSPLTLYALTL